MSYTYNFASGHYVTLDDDNALDLEASDYPYELAMLPLEVQAMLVAAILELLVKVRAAEQATS